VNSIETDSWLDLFGPADRAGSRLLSFHTVQRGGIPLLFLPPGKREALSGLTLYPAQSTRARLAKKLLEIALRVGLRPGLERVQFEVAVEDTFAAFLRQSARTAAPPTFAVLAGNPRARGRRFVFLLLDAAGLPAAVVKAGASEAAQSLIEHEENFLRANAGMPGLPALRGGFESSRARAFALDFAAGNSPRGSNLEAPGNLLTSWLARDREMRMRDLESWRLLMASEAFPMGTAMSALAETKFHPTLMHGDFAPWNVKVCAGHWTVLDWERGQLEGVPGWDWFHFELQPALLVRHETAAQLFTRCERILASSDFLAYAAAAGIGPHARALLLAYLANCLCVTKQTEGREPLLELEQRVANTRFARPA